MRKTTNISSQDKRYPGRVLNRAPPEYKATVLPLDQLAQWNRIGSFPWFSGYLITEQEVLGRTNRLLSFDTARNAKENDASSSSVYCCMCIRYRVKVFTEPFPINGNGIYIQPGGRDL
jgi:hypothetical protein